MKRLSKDGITIYFAESLIDRMRGVIGRENILENGALLLKDCNWVHSFFIKNNVDLYFLNQEFSVLGSVYNLNTFRFSCFNLSARHVLEVKRGFAKAHLNTVLDVIKES